MVRGFGWISQRAFILFRLFLMGKEHPTMALSGQPIPRAFGSNTTTREREWFQRVPTGKEQTTPPDESFQLAFDEKAPSFDDLRRGALCAPNAALGSRPIPPITSRDSKFRRPGPDTSLKWKIPWAGYRRGSRPRPRPARPWTWIAIPSGPFPPRHGISPRG